MPRKSIAAIAGAGLALAATTASLAAVPKTGVFKGQTNQTNPQGQHAKVQAKVTKHGRLIKKASIQWHAVCHNVPDGYEETSMTKQGVSKSGKFSSSGTYSHAAPGGDSVTITAHWAGKFVKPRKLTGTFRATAKVYDSSDALVDTCKTGKVTYKATR